MHATFNWPGRAMMGASFLALGLAAVACGGQSPGTTGADGGTPGAPSGTSGAPGGRHRVGTARGAPGGRHLGGQGTEPGTTTMPSCSVKTDTVLSSAGASSPAIAFGGGRFAVAWTGAADGQLHLAIVDEDGKVLGDQVLSAGQAAQQADVSALADDGFLVTWQEVAGGRGAVRARRVGMDGAPREDAFTVKTTAGGDARPCDDADAKGTAVAWVDMNTLHVADLKGTSLQGEQTLASAGDPALAPDHDGFGLAFTSGARLGFARLKDPIGSLSPVYFRNAPGTANVPRLAAGSDGSFAYVWEDARAGAGNEAVYFARIGADGQASDEVRVSSDAGSADYPDVAMIGNYAAVVYYQFRAGPPSIYLTLVGPDRARAGEDLELSEKGARFPRIAGRGGTLGVAYADRSGPARISVIDCR
jgi:hypothetical protein